MKKEKKVRVTLELTSTFLNLLTTNVHLKTMPKLKKGCAQLEPIELVGFLVQNEARGTHGDAVWGVVPMGNRPDCPDVIYDERRVYEDGEQIS